MRSTIIRLWKLCCRYANVSCTRALRLLVAGKTAYCFLKMNCGIVVNCQKCHCYSLRILSAQLPPLNPSPYPSLGPLTQCPLSANDALHPTVLTILTLHNLHMEYPPPLSLTAHVNHGALSSTQHHSPAASSAQAQADSFLLHVSDRKKLITDHKPQFHCDPCEMTDHDESTTADCRDEKSKTVRSYYKPC